MAGEAINHGERAHALLSASSAYRWLTCTPSARLEDNYKEDAETSTYAAEGTLAHELSEVELRYALDLLSLEDYVAKKNEIAKSEYYGAEMIEEVDKYVGYVLDVWKEAKAADPLAEIFIEDRLDLTPWVPEGFGTNDVVIISASTLSVIDLKYGKGVRVKAEENPQLKLYGLGALDKHGFNYAIDLVTLTIHQPRLNSVSTATVNAEDLEAWGLEEVAPRAALAFLGMGDFVPGNHCHFCKAATRCRALAEENLKLAAYDFAEPEELSDEELIAIYEKLDFFTKWANKLSAYVQAEALAGKSWPGFKLVEGRSVRQITDEAAAAKALEAAGFTSDKFTNVKLKGLTDLTKLLGKVEFEAVLGPYIIKPQGKPTLAPADDPRPVFNHINDFDNEEEI
jgi:hypothetical protein